MHLVVLAFLVLISMELRAQSEPFQVDWVPDNFFVVCDKEDECPLNRERSLRVADMMGEAVNGMKKMPFDAPKDWGLRVGKGTANDYIELYQRNEGLAAASPRCGNPGKPGSSIYVGPSVFKPGFRENDYLLFYFMAHEIFHLVQYNYPFFSQENCREALPGWIKEGTAAAVAQEAMRQRYPGSWPSVKNEREARNFSGMRRYDEPLPRRQKSYTDEEMFTGDQPQYWTSSFWLHIARAYHRGSYRYLHNYMKRSARNRDWVRWLRDNIEDDLEADLGLVFSGFLADYAGWGDPGYPGAYFDRQKWLGGVFGGCERVYLDRKKAQGWVELELLPLAGKCIEVRVPTIGELGLKEGDSAAVQIAGLVMSGSGEARNGLHLSLAASNDKAGFHCAKEAKAGRKFGIGKCMMLPDDGKLRLVGAPVDARVWNVRAQEPGGEPIVALKNGGESVRRQEQGEGKGELVNLYTVSYTPENVSTSDTIYGGRDSVTARIYFVLDVARLQVNGQARKGAVGAMGAPSADPQTTVPKQDTAGSLVNSFSKPDRFQAPLTVSTAVPAQAEGKLTFFSTATSADNADSQTAVVLFPARENAQGKLEAHPLSVGETGTYSLLIEADIDTEPAVSLPGSSLVVEEFTDLVFRARYSGTLCLHRDLIPGRPGQPAENPCRNPFPVSGEVVKAFAGSRLPGRYMVTERTRGTEMYRKAGERGVEEWQDGMPGEGASDPVASPPRGSTGTGGAIGECNCTCEERAETERVGMEMKRRMEAGEEVVPGAVMGLMRCNSPCRAEYAVCAIQEDKARKAQEKEQAARAREALKDGDACDCSCEGIRAMQGQTEAIMQAMEAGSPTAMGDLQRLGECVSACNEELSKCIGGS